MLKRYWLFAPSAEQLKRAKLLQSLTGECHHYLLPASKHDQFPSLFAFTAENQKPSSLACEITSLHSSLTCASVVDTDAKCEFRASGSMPCSSSRCWGSKPRFRNSRHTPFLFVSNACEILICIKASQMTLERALKSLRRASNSFGSFLVLLWEKLIDWLFFICRLGSNPIWRMRNYIHLYNLQKTYKKFLLP